MSKHTPTPWKIDEHSEKYIVPEGDIEKSICEIFSGNILDSEATANAALIVTAVNNHQKLVDAVEGLLQELSHAKRVETLRGGATIKQAQDFVNEYPVIKLTKYFIASLKPE